MVQCEIGPVMVKRCRGEEDGEDEGDTLVVSEERCSPLDSIWVSANVLWYTRGAKWKVQERIWREKKDGEMRDILCRIPHPACSCSIFIFSSFNILHLLLLRVESVGSILFTNWKENKILQLNLKVKNEFWKENQTKNLPSSFRDSKQLALSGQTKWNLHLWWNGNLM